MTDDDLTPAQRRHRARLANAKAAQAANRARAALPVDRPAVVVVRPTNTTYSWEIRRYGAMVMLRGTERFSSTAEARCAGEAALSALLMRDTATASL